MVDNDETAVLPWDVNPTQALTLSLSLPPGGGGSGNNSLIVWKTLAAGISVSGRAHGYFLTGQNKN